jgi:hypothetical protein
MALGLLAALAVLLLPAAEADFVLIKDGKPAAAIVVDAACLATTPGPEAAKRRAAALDLQDVVRRISGALLPIASADAPPAGRLILIGPSPAATKTAVAIPSGLTPERKEEGFVLHCTADRLLLAGNDAGPYHGTEYAVYSLLHRLGARWYMPGPFGEYLPSTPDLSLPAVTDRQTPSFRLRNWWLHTNAEMAAQERVWKLRNGMSPETPIAIPGDSSVRGVVADAALAATKPELFAKNADGTPNLSLPNLTGAEARQLAADKVKAIFRADPNVVSHGIAPDDGLPRDFGAETRKLNQNFVQLGGREGEPAEVSTSEEWFSFVNAVTREVNKEFPDRIVVTNGYANRDLPPFGVEIDPHISVMYAAIWSDTLHAYDDPKSWQSVRQGQNLRRWASMCDKVWVYGYDYTMLTTGLTPVPVTRKIAHDLPLMQKWGVIGFHSESRNVWMESGILTRYLRARLQWNTSLDVKGLAQDFYSHWYAAAATPAMAFWDAIEQVIEGTHLLGHEDRVLPYVYTPELIAALEGHVAEAERLAEDERSKLHVRADRLILDHLKAYMAMNQAEYDGKFSEAARLADAMMACRKRLYSISPLYCLADEQRYDSGVWYWGALDRAAYYRKLADQTEGRTGDLVALLPEKTAFRTDPTDTGRFAGWYEPSVSAAAWPTVATTKPFYAQGFMAGDGYPYTGAAWYRFTVDVPAWAKGRNVRLFAPAAETEAWAWVNARYVGHKAYREAYERPNELSLDVSDALKPGARNEIAIRVHTSLNPAAAAGGLVSRVMLIADK